MKRNRMKLDEKLFFLSNLHVCNCLRKMVLPRFVGEITLHLRWKNFKKDFSFQTIWNRWGRIALYLGRDYISQNAKFWSVRSIELLFLLIACSKFATICIHQFAWFQFQKYKFFSFWGGHIPLSHIFAKKCQRMDLCPRLGGVCNFWVGEEFGEGFGRQRIVLGNNSDFLEEDVVDCFVLLWRVLPNVLKLDKIWLTWFSSKNRIHKKFNITDGRDKKGFLDSLLLFYCFYLNYMYCTLTETFHCKC